MSVKLKKMSNEYIKSPLNYTGGKHKLLPQIMPLFPNEIDMFVDLFCGGANVGINCSANKVIYNDNNSQLIGLLKTFDKNEPKEIIKKIEKLIYEYELSDSNRNGYEYYDCNSAEGLGKYNKTRYLKLRDDFNSLTKKNDKYYMHLFTLIIFAFNNQIRFNSDGDFNLPVGKRDFNKNIQSNLVQFIEKLHSQNTQFTNKDFREFKIEDFSKNDFVYCDPPYLITTASYNEMGGWTEKDEKELLSFLDNLDNVGIRFALSNVMSHKGKDNDILLEWSKKYTVHNLSFNYKNSSYHGKDLDKETKEVLITNY